MTKNNPSEFDCYAKAEPDEPLFTLLARDPVSGNFVRMWAFIRAGLIDAAHHEFFHACQSMVRSGKKPLANEDRKFREALDCANSMWEWKQQPDSLLPTLRPGFTFRKKPLLIEAFQMTQERRGDNRDWPHWLNEAWNKEPEEVGAVFPADRFDSDGKDKLRIRTLEGVVKVDWNDWIIQGIKGELYPCKPDIFEATYEAANE